jgi:hypothetical protein
MTVWSRYVSISCLVNIDEHWVYTGSLLGIASKYVIKLSPSDQAV